MNDIEHGIGPMIQSLVANEYFVSETKVKTPMHELE